MKILDHIEEILSAVEDNIIKYAEEKHGIPIEKMEECYECEGGGWIAKLYPNGHTEMTCDVCMGVGYIEYY